MKRLFISLAAILCVAATASAQTLIVVEEKPVLTNKKGAPILPQAGDMSIGISTTPFFTYLATCSPVTVPIRLPRSAASELAST